MKFVSTIVLVWTLLAGREAPAEQKQFSGPQRGESITPFKVLQFETPEKGKEVEVARSDARGATLLIFFHKFSEPALGLAITLEWYAHQQEGLVDQYVILAQDRGKTEQQLKRWSERSFLADSLLSVSLDGPEGPGRYGLNRNVDMTVLIARDNEVLSNFAIVGPNNTDAPAILAALADVMDKPAPSFDAIQTALRAEREKRRNKTLRENPVFKLAPHAELGTLMVSLVVSEVANEGRAKRVAGQLEEWAGDDAQKRRELEKYSQAVLSGGFARDRYAREALQKLAGNDSP